MKADFQAFACGEFAIGQPAGMKQRAATAAQALAHRRSYVG
jgi:hypothetical protein